MVDILQWSTEQDIPLKPISISLNWIFDILMMNLHFVLSIILISFIIASLIFLLNKQKGRQFLVNKNKFSLIRNVVWGLIFFVFIFSLAFMIIFMHDDALISQSILLTTEVVLVIVVILLIHVIYSVVAWQKKLGKHLTYVPKTWNDLGDLFLNHGMYDGATPISKIIASPSRIHIDSKNLESWNDLGDLFLNHGMYDGATPISKIIASPSRIHIDSKNLESWTDLGDLFLNRGIYGGNDLICRIVPDLKMKRGFMDI
jgi:hypothetical protein